MGSYRADRFGGRISFANGTATLTGAELRRGNTILQINGTATQLGFNPQVQGQIKVVQGEIQDVLGFLQFFDLQDFGRGLNPPSYGVADTVRTVPVDLDGVPIQEQLRRLSEIEALLAQQRAQRDSAPIPELRELQANLPEPLTLVVLCETG
ncbi:MAG: hypothetical protein HC866_10765 [Leptolyngbyaceae cyanobacterium RU_5_1]|nr:hypothetical protein [Leptolyngbyaceae cyanobacterium RU_5_1]